MDDFNIVIINTLIIITSISTVVLVLEALGFLPHTISKYLVKNKLGLTREVLKELGLPIQETKAKISKCLSVDNLRYLTDKLDHFTYNINVGIGKTRDHHTTGYIDLMGATTNVKNAKDFARILKSFVFESGCIDLSKVDIVVTSKLGSPILGYEFSKNIDKPFMLHSSEQKFRTENPDYQIQQYFDTGGCNDLQGKTALIIDDSTTGGRKVLETAKDLRNNGISVSDCLVVFAPQGKKAKELLFQEGITLHAILETHNEGERK